MSGQLATPTATEQPKTTVTEPAPQTKAWYESKTVMVNLFAMAALMIQAAIGFTIRPEEQIALLAVLNLALRIVTKTELA